MAARITLPNYVKAISHDKIDDASRSRLSRVASILPNNGQYWSHTAVWANVATIAEKMYAAGNASGLSAPTGFKYTNYVPMFLDDDAFVSILNANVTTKTAPVYSYGRSVSQRSYQALDDTYRQGVVTEITKRNPQADPKTIKMVVTVLEGSPANHEYRLFHLVALNEFLIDEANTDTTFGEYLKDTERFNSVHEKMMTFNLTSGTRTAEMFSLASGRNQWDKEEFVLWYQNLPSTKNLLMGMTADQYENAFKNGQLRTSVNAASKRLKTILDTPEKKTTRQITHFDYDVEVIKALSGHRQAFSEVSMPNPTAVIGEVITELSFLYSRTTASPKPGGNPNKYGVEASIVLEVFTFLAENAGEFSLDEIMAIFITLITSNTVVKSGGSEDTFRLYQHVIRTTETEQAVMFFRLAAYIVTRCRGLRPTRTEWNAHIKDGMVLGLDPSLSAGFVVSKEEPESGSIPNGKLRYWRLKFGEKD